MSNKELSVGTNDEQRITVDISTLAIVEASPMLSAALSSEEQKWYERLRDKILESKRHYYCSWWLRLDYENTEPNVTTSKINYWLSKLVKKGLLTKKVAKTHTQYSLTDVVR